MSDSKEFRDLIVSLKKADTKDKEQFRLLLNRGMKLLKLLDRDIAHEFGASRPTVTRWKNGKNAPHPAMRKPIFSYLQKRATALSRKSNNRKNRSRV